MKWSLRDRLGTGLLVLGFALALPAYAQMDEMMKPSVGSLMK